MSSYTPTLVAFGYDCSYYARFADGHSCWEGLPTGLHNKLNGRQKSLPPVDILALNPASSWEAFVQFKDGKQTWWVDDPDFTKTMHSRNKRVEHVALGPDGTWFVRWVDGDWWYNLPGRLANRLNGRQAYLPQLKRVVMDEWGGYWVMFEDGLTWWHDLPVPDKELRAEGRAPDSFDQAMGFMELDPDDIRYTQRSIGQYLSGYDNYTIYDLAEDLGCGSVDITDIEKIRVVQDGSDYWSLDNRRLWAFKEAGLSSVPVRLVDANGEFYRKRNTVDGGWSVHVRGS
ncbi:hypothetical protein HK102_001534 [Quaeritorhiza haematococci]|nr:hypothetical protein HK102_001534 [Quaeritorhiza haematococci]